MFTIVGSHNHQSYKWQQALGVTWVTNFPPFHHIATWKILPLLAHQRLIWTYIRKTLQFLRATCFLWKNEPTQLNDI
jgi:hypothetical protein